MLIDFLGCGRLSGGALYSRHTPRLCLRERLRTSNYEEGSQWALVHNMSVHIIVFTRVFISLTTIT